MAAEYWRNEQRAGAVPLGHAGGSFGGGGCSRTDTVESVEDMLVCSGAVHRLLLSKIRWSWNVVLITRVDLH